MELKEQSDWWRPAVTAVVLEANKIDEKIFNGRCLWECR